MRLLLAVVGKRGWNAAQDQCMGRHLAGRLRSSLADTWLAGSNHRPIRRLDQQAELIFFSFFYTCGFSLIKNMSTSRLSNLCF
jgi:hypothetical protein